MTTNSISNPNSRIIEIHRHFNLIEMSQEDPEVKAWLGESFKPIGPYFENKMTATGLSREEEKILMSTSSGVGLEPNDRLYRQAVTNFYDNLITKVPKDGLKLEVGLVESNDKPLSETNLPINVRDYIIYRHAIRHPDVANSQADAKRDFRKRFYILDKAVTLQNNIKTNELEDTALRLYMTVKEDLVKTDQILTLMGQDIEKMSKHDKVLALKNLALRNKKLNEPDQNEAYKRFIDLCNDKDLELKFLIEEAIAIQYLKRIGNDSIVYAETGKEIGTSIQDAVLYFKSDKRSRELNLLKATYQEKSKRGKEYFKQAKAAPEPTKPEASSAEETE